MSRSRDPLGDRPSFHCTSCMTLGESFNYFGSQPPSLKVKKLEQLISRIPLALEFPDSVTKFPEPMNSDTALGRFLFTKVSPSESVLEYEPHCVISITFLFLLKLDWRLSRSGLESHRTQQEGRLSGGFRECLSDSRLKCSPRFQLVSPCSYGGDWSLCILRTRKSQQGGLRLDPSTPELLAVPRVDAGIVLRGNSFGRDHSVGEFIHADPSRCAAGVESSRDTRFR